MLTVSVAAAEVPPPGVALLTVIERLPAEAISLAVIVAVSCVLLTKVVARSAPFTWIRDPLTKLLPLTVRVKAAPPAITVLGEMLVSDGTGLLTVKVRAPLVPPEGVFTVIDSEPATARSAAVSVAVNWVLLTNVVVRLAPLTRIVDALVKFEPVAVSVTGPLPAMADVGEIAVSVGLVALIVRL